MMNQDKHQFTVQKLNFEVKYNKNIELIVTNEDGTEYGHRWSFVFVFDTEGKLRCQGLYDGGMLKFSVGQNMATQGCVSGSVPVGEWKALYMTEDEIVPLKISVVYKEEDPNSAVAICYDTEDILNNKAGWYKGDLHVHTTLSDGEMTIDELEENMKKKNLDYLFITDHNMINYDAKSNAGIFTGIELTSRWGHINLFNLGYMTYDKMIDILGLIMDRDNFDGYDSFKNTVCSINHPFLGSWKFLYKEFPMRVINALEVITDPGLNIAADANKRALRFLNFLYLKGHRITGIGGSDIHYSPYKKDIDDEYVTRPRCADPITSVFSEKLAASAIIKGISKGNAYVSRTLDIKTDIQDGKYLPGDKVEERTISYAVRIRGEGKKYIIQFIKDNQIYEECPLTQQGVRINVTFENEYHYVSVAIWDENNELEAYINPVYYGEKHPEFKTWGEAIESFFEKEVSVCGDRPSTFGKKRVQRS